MRHLRVALGQLPVKVGDLEGNRKAIAGLMLKAESEQADVLLTPEMSLTGYPVEDLLAEDEFINATWGNLQALSKSAGSTLTLAGAPVRRSDLPALGGAGLEGGKLDALKRSLVNAACVLHQGRLVAAHAKTLLPTYSVFDDARWFSPGTNNQDLITLDTPDGLVTAGVLVCEDIWDETLARKAVNDGAEILLVLNASPYHSGKPLIRQELLLNLSKNLKTPICYLNSVGGQDELVFDGGSMVVTPDGMVARSSFFEPDYQVIDVPLGEGRKVGRPTFQVTTYKGTRSPLLVQPSVAEILPPHDEVYAALVEGMRSYCKRIGMEKILLGLSGGIDSALAATVCVDALGSDNVWGVGLPGPYSSEGSVTDARELALNLGVRFDVIPIEEAYFERERVLMDLATLRAGERGREVAPVAWENLQARLRGVTLMTLANACGYLVCSTGNRAESAVGYFTLYGDSCGTAPNPLGDLTKTDVVLKDGSLLPGVYGLSEWRNSLAIKRGEVPPIPVSTLTKPPSAELAEGQQDTDSLPPYPILDAMLVEFLENHASFETLVQQLIDSGYNQEEATRQVTRVLGLIDRSEFKRRQVPFRIKISRLAFGRDRRMPLANHYKHTGTSA